VRPLPINAVCLSGLGRSCGSGLRRGLGGRFCRYLRRCLCCLATPFFAFAHRDFCAAAMRAHTSRLSFYSFLERRLCEPPACRSSSLAATP